MSLTFETTTYTGEPRDDIQVNDSVEWAIKQFSYEFLGETRTIEVKTLKDNFVVSGVFDATACEAHLDAQGQGILNYYNMEKWFRDPETGVAI